MAMTSSRPYLIRALHEWIVDNACTPHVVVNARAAGVVVPQQHVKDGQIVLNVAPSAVANFVLDNDEMRFDARFSGVPMRIVVPTYAVMGIYARENGQGMIFEPEDPPTPPDDTGGESSSAEQRPKLKVVK
jgi:stringent starvation protein B